MTAPNWDSWLMKKNAAKQAIEQFGKRTKVEVGPAYGAKGELPTPGPGGFLFSAVSLGGADCSNFFIGLDRARWPMELEHIACTLRWAEMQAKKEEDEKMGAPVTPDAGVSNVRAEEE